MTARYDLVDVAREWLSMGPCLAVRDKIDAKAPAEQLKQQVCLSVYVGHACVRGIRARARARVCVYVCVCVCVCV
jgi:hypothetical protein